jgi:hypothetical protein
MTDADHIHLLPEDEEILPTHPDGELTPDGLLQASRLCDRIESLRRAIGNLEDSLRRAELKLVDAIWWGEDAERLIVPCLTPAGDSYLIEPKVSGMRISPSVTRTSWLTAKTREPVPAVAADPAERANAPTHPLMRRLLSP